MSKVMSSIATVLLVIFCALIYYAALPAFTLRSPGFWVFLLICAVCLAISLTLFCYDDLPETAAIVGWIIAAVVLVGLLIGTFSSWMVFHAQKAYNVADVTVSTTSIAEDFPNLEDPENLKNLPLVDLDTARMLGDKKVAQLKHASWYEVDDEYNLVKTSKGYYRLSVIDYGSFWKYNKAKAEGLPGYVLVNVTPEKGVATQDASISELDDTIRYSPEAYWSFDLLRHLRRQFRCYMFDTSYLEIDDEGTPYWVTGVLRPTGGLFGVQTVSTFILTDARTGVSQEYSVDKAPAWVDHIFSLDYLMKIAEWHYAYADGYWNDMFSQTNVWRTSYYYRSDRDDDSDSDASKFANFFGYSSIVNKDGEVMFYTGLTAANNAESNLGWLTIDTSTGKMTQYDIVGAEESSAQRAVEQLVQAQGYEATFPLPANISGEPSYIMCLKGKAGLAQAYGICNVENYSIAVQADTLDEAIRLYRQKLGYDASGEPVTDEVAPETSRPNELPSDTTNESDISHETQTAEGVIGAIFTAELDGTTQFYYLIDNELYRAALKVNERQILFVSGDRVTFSYYETEDLRQITSISKL